MSATPARAHTEREDLLGLLDRAIDARIDARIDALATRLRAKVGRHFIHILRSEIGTSGVEGQLLLTVAAAAKMLSLSRSTVHELIRRGDLPSVKIGGTRRIRPAAPRSTPCTSQPRAPQPRRAPGT